MSILFALHVFPADSLSILVALPADRVATPVYHVAIPVCPVATPVYPLAIPADHG